MSDFVVKLCLFKTAQITKGFVVIKVIHVDNITLVILSIAVKTLYSSNLNSKL